MGKLRSVWSLVLLLVSISLLPKCQAFVVPIRQLLGISVCQIGESTHTYSGFSIETFRLAARLIGLVETDDAIEEPLTDTSTSFKFVCTDYTATQAVAFMTSGSDISPIQAPVFVGLFTISKERIQMGIQFSFAYLRTGAAVMIPTFRSKPDWWAMFRPFTPSLWIALILTALFQPLLTWIVERLALRGTLQLDKMLRFVKGHEHQHHEGWLSPGATSVASFQRDNAIKTTYLYEELKISMYQGIMSAFQTLTQDVRSLPGMLLNIAFSFLTLVVISTYTATLTQFVQTGNKLLIPDPGHLMGRKVAAYGLYVDDLRRFYGISATRYDNFSIDTFYDIGALLENHTYVAYIYDAPTLTHLIDVLDTECRFSLLDQLVTPFDVGFPFHPSIPPTVVKKFNDALMASLRSGAIDGLYSSFIEGGTYGSNRCSLTGSDDQKMGLDEMAGLWIILAAATGLALAISTGSALYSAFYHAVRREEHKQGFCRRKPPTFREIIKKGADLSVWKSILRASKDDLTDFDYGNAMSFRSAKSHDPRPRPSMFDRKAAFSNGRPSLQHPGGAMHPSGVLSPPGGHSNRTSIDRDGGGRDSWEQPAGNLPPRPAHHSRFTHAAPPGERHERHSNGTGDSDGESKYLARNSASAYARQGHGKGSGNGQGQGYARGTGTHHVHFGGAQPAYSPVSNAVGAAARRSEMYDMSADRDRDRSARHGRPRNVLTYGGVSQGMDMMERVSEADERRVMASPVVSHTQPAHMSGTRHSNHVSGRGSTLLPIHSGSGSGNGAGGQAQPRPAPDQGDVAGLDLLDEIRITLPSDWEVPSDSDR